MLSSLFLLRLSLFVFTVGFFVFVFFLIVLSIIVNVTRASPSGCFTGSITIFSSCLPFPPPPPAPHPVGGQVTRNCTENTSIEEYFVQEVTTQILLFRRAQGCRPHLIYASQRITSGKRWPEHARTRLTCPATHALLRRQVGCPLMSSHKAGKYLPRYRIRAPVQN